MASRVEGQALSLGALGGTQLLFSWGEGMFNRLSLGKKLAVGFGSIIAVALALGVVGYYGAVRNHQMIDELGVVRLPSVQSLLVISEAQTAIDGAENALLSRELSLQSREALYARFAAAWKRVEDAWKVYEPLPQTTEEARQWKEFVPAWNAWRKDHEQYAALSRQYDRHVDPGLKADDLHQRMTAQALVTNPKSFAAAGSLLHEILDLCVPAAQGPQAQAAEQSADPATHQALLMAVSSLGVINEAQTAIDAAENALLSRDINLAAREEIYAEMTAAWKRVDQAWKAYESLPRSPEASQLWAKFVPAWNAWKQGHEQYVSLSKEYDPLVDGCFEAGDVYRKMTEQALVLNAKTFAPAEALLGSLVKINADVAAVTTKDAVAQAGLFKALSLVAMGAALIIALAPEVLITRSITHPLRALFKGLKAFSTAELRQTGEHFNRIISGLTESVSQVNDAAGQVASASQQLAEGASEQASSLEETSSALEEMASMTQTNAGHAKQANDLAIQARHAADGGEKTMSAISESSGQISKIIKVIEEIAFQTNLLALNAAVEAARAGEHGKGFAVVADEVRSLAQRAAQAARETTDLIENSVSKSNEGTEAIKGIVGNVCKLT